MTMTIDDIQAREARHVLQTYRRAAGHVRARRGRAPVRRRGARVPRPAVGHRRRLARPRAPGPGARRSPSRRRRCSTRRTCSIHPLQGQLAERLANLSGLPRAFFCNSGTEAVEACLKFARRYWYTRGEPRAEIIALEESFHGRTFGRAVGHVGRALPRAVRAAAAGRAVRAGQRSGGAARGGVVERRPPIIAEPIQGEGGVRPLTPAFAAAINEACAKTGALLIADEVQSGLGRTGYPFYFAALGLKPHLVSVGKALGGGVPVGAALVSEEVADTISFGDHGSTYGGNLLACRAALCFLDELVGGGLLGAHRRASAGIFEQRLRAMAARHPIVKEVRGAGLMWGLELTRDAAPVVPAGLARGVDRQPHGRDRRPAAAAARHHRSRSRRGARPARRGARRRGSGA